jgi:hypothetical protein
MESEKKKPLQNGRGIMILTNIKSTHKGFLIEKKHRYNLLSSYDSLSYWIWRILIKTIMANITIFGTLPKKF